MFLRYSFYFSVPMQLFLMCIFYALEAHLY